MKANIATLAAMCCLSVAHAQEPAPVTAAEFDQITANPMKLKNASSGAVVQVHLKAGGSAVISQAYNDVGDWKRKDDASYCVRWSKQRPEERCSTIVRRDGKVGFIDPSGQLAWWLQE